MPERGSTPQPTSSGTYTWGHVAGSVRAPACEETTEGAVVPQRAVVPAGSIAAGVPARLLDRPVDDEYKAAWLGFKQLYVDLCERYRAGYGR